MSAPGRDQDQDGGEGMANARSLRKLTYRTWMPAALMAVGAVATLSVSVQRSLPLRAPLNTTIPATLAGAKGVDLTISPDERRVAGMSQYLLRSYGGAGGAPHYSVYVGYYENQRQGQSIHSPKNCLPGSGWEPLESEQVTLPSSVGPLRANKYFLRNGNQLALVFYWYQGRGRIVASEYAVKWYLLRDSALRRRSDEALVRIVVPVTASEAAAESIARRVAVELAPAVSRALPT